eukprot:3362575-Rhodomonas_salina.2
MPRQRAAHCQSSLLGARAAVMRVLSAFDDLVCGCCELARRLTRGALPQALKLVMSEVRHIREEALVRVKASTRGKTSSRGAGSFFRKRQGRELDRADRAQIARSFTFSGSRLASPQCNVAFAAQFHAGLVWKLELDSQFNSGRGLQSSC